MTSRLDNWLGYQRLQDQQSPGVQASVAWKAILDDPTTIQPIRSSDPSVEEQVVRVVFRPGGTTIVNESGYASNIKGFDLFGVKDHPSPEVPDTNIMRGDRFVIGSYECLVEDVNEFPGEIIASGRAIS